MIKMQIEKRATWLFLRSLLRDPRAVGAVSPSSPGLSQLMASGVSCCNSHVLEIGAGTGSITKALLRRGLSPDRLIVVERDPLLASYLRERFPKVRVRCADALQASAILAREAITKVNAVVSSLPLRNFSPREKLATMRALLKILTPGGQLIQFTYAPDCPIPARQLGLRAERMGRIWMNLPPASVWRFTRS